MAQRKLKSAIKYARNGLLAVVTLFGGAAVAVVVLLAWTSWAFGLKSTFWSIALSPLGALFALMIFIVFAIGAEGGR